MCLGIPARVVSVDEPNGLSRPATVTRSDGAEMRVDLAMVPEALPGDHVVTHSGFAVSLLTEEEVGEANRLLDEMKEGDSPATAT